MFNEKSIAMENWQTIDLSNNNDLKEVENIPKENNMNITHTVGATSSNVDVNKVDSGLHNSTISFNADCGPNLITPLLSIKLALANSAFSHPGVIESDYLSYKPHSLFSSFGWHDNPFQKMICKNSPGNGILDKYGIGIVLWFKLLVNIIISI